MWMRNISANAASPFGQYKYINTNNLFSKSNVQAPGRANLPQGSLPRPRKRAQEFEARLAMSSRQKSF
jgi:hypothetical protein